MPDNPAADDYADSLIDEVSADDYADSLLAEDAQPPDPVEDARELAANVPQEARTLQQPQNERPWHVNAFEDVVNSPMGKALTSGAEGLAAGFTSQLPDEIGAGVMEGMSTPLERENQGYQGISAERPENDYAAGSQFEDARGTLEQERAERREQDPIPGMIGEGAGALGQAALLPGATMTRALPAAAAAVGQTASNYMGAGSGGLDERAGQALETAKENPALTAASVVLPAAGAGIGGALSRAAPKLQEASYLNRVAAFMPSGQRARYAASKGGKQGLINLGKRVVEAGLHKSNPESWYGGLGPASAENMYDNAVALEGRGAASLDAAEDVLKAANPGIPVKNVAEDLRGGAADLTKMADPAKKGEISFRNEFAQGFDKATELPAEGPAYKPPVPEITPREGPWTPEVAPQASNAAPVPPKPVPREGPIAPEIPARQVAPEEWFSYLDDAKKLPAGSPLPPAPIAQEFVPARGPGQLDPSPAEWRAYQKALEKYGRPPEPGQPSVGPGEYIPTKEHWESYRNFEPIPPAPGKASELPFSEAVAQRRYIDKQTNFTPSGLGESAQNAVRRQTGTALRKNIGEGLDQAAVADPELAAPVAQWKKGNADFSLSQTVQDPALVSMQSEFGGGLGLRDMATSTAAHALGVPAPAALAASRMMRGGRGANALAGTQQNLSDAFKGLGAALPPGALAAGQTARGSAEIVKEKNQSMVDQLNEAMRSGWNWATQWGDK